MTGECFDLEKLENEINITKQQYDADLKGFENVLAQMKNLDIQVREGEAEVGAQQKEIRAKQAKLYEALAELAKTKDMSKETESILQNIADMEMQKQGLAQELASKDEEYRTLVVNIAKLHVRHSSSTYFTTWGSNKYAFDFFFLGG